MFGRRSFSLAGGGRGVDSLLIAMAAPLVVWFGVFAYLVHLDAKVRKLGR